MNDSQLRTIEQIKLFLKSSALVTFSAHGDDAERYAHISSVLKRFDYPEPKQARTGRSAGLPSAYQRLQPPPSHQAGRPPARQPSPLPSAIMRLTPPLRANTRLPILSCL